MAKTDAEKKMESGPGTPPYLREWAKEVNDLPDMPSGSVSSASSESSTP